MNKKWNAPKKSSKNSPILFEDEEMGTSSPDEIKLVKTSATPKTRPYSGHSTPIQNKYKINSSNSPELNYSESPIEPLTQHPPNEVGWDYQRPVTLELDKNPTSMEISKTPKRSIFLSKKRNSNSPLLYKPLKKKLIQEEQQEDMAGFMAELKAMEIKAIEIKAMKQSGERSDTLHKNKNEIESQLIIEIDSERSDDSDLKLQVSINTNESPEPKIVNINKNNNALFDDSIEDIMVLCTQQVEEKVSSLEKMLKTKSQKNVQSLTSAEKILSDSSSKNSSTSKGESGSLEIPDDSFDDFFVEIDDKDLCKNTNTEVFTETINKLEKTLNKPYRKSLTETKTLAMNTNNVQNKFFQSKSSNYSTQTKIITSSNCNFLTDSQASNAVVQNKIINAKANFGYLNKDYVKNNSNNSCFSHQAQTDCNTNVSKPNDMRLFKTKSFSDTNFLQQSNSNNNLNNTHRSTSNLNVNSIKHKHSNDNFIYQNTQSSYYASGSSVENKGLRKTYSSSSLGKSLSSSSQQLSSNRFSSNEKSQSLSTPAEIEKKRQEAILKREAKLKSKLNNGVLKRPIQYPVKR